MIDNTNMDKATEQAWNGWTAFTKAVFWSGVAGAAVLIVLAIVIP